MKKLEKKLNQIKFFKIRFSKITGFTSIVILLALSGCVHYAPKFHLTALNTGVCVAENQKNKQVISFEYHVFNKQDCIKYLDRDVISKGYQPIQITIKNDTTRYLNFSIKDFNISCVDEGEVAQKLHANTKGRAAGYGTAALFVWPFAIPAIVDGIGSSDSNKKLDLDFYKKSLHDQIINPGSMINGLVFVLVNSYNPKNFKFVLKDIKNDKRYTLSSSEKVLRV